MNSLRGSVVVLTGASSGLGRAAAIALGERGCRVVLAARRAVDLEETARLCRTAGGEALVVVTDVSVPDDVTRLVDAAISAWDHIDVWVNNAGITAFGLLADVALAEHRRVLETNLFGALACAHAVLPHFRARNRGTLVNVGSVLSQVGQPFVPSYVVSKFGLRGLSEALRTELADEPDIHVCSLLPYAIDTPHFQSGANYVGRRARAMPPVQSPEEVAEALVSLIERPRRHVHVPRAATLGLAVRWALPDLTDRLILHALQRWHFDEHPQRATSGNLRHPVEVGDARVQGTRPPLLSAWAFAAWVLGDLAMMAVRAIIRSGRPRPGTPPIPLGTGAATHRLGARRKRARA